MLSERRFHPLTVVFALGGELRRFLVPLIFATLTARSRGQDAQIWFLIFLLPGVVMAGARYWFSTYRYDDTELVVHTGLLFRNERHIPYARIQSVDAVQNVLHRFFGVVDVKVRTGTGGEADATLSVLPFSALNEMREHVFERKRMTAGMEAVVPEAAGTGADQPQVAAARASAVPLLQLSPRALALSGLLDNRGWVVIGALSGVVWESGAFDRVEEWSSLAESSWMVAAAVAAGLFVISPVLSVVWAVVQLWGFRVSQRGQDLMVEYGAFTRVTGTVPLLRVQVIRIAQGLGHVWCGRSSVRVETAGGTGEKAGQSEREWIAPIIRASELDAFVRHILPGASLDTVEWLQVDGRAFRRRGRRAAMAGCVLGAVTTPWIGWWAGVAVLFLVAAGVFSARQYVRHLGWARTAEAVYVRTGWLRRTITIVPVPKIQCVQLVESPFDRRWAMASLGVDTAGAGPHQLEIPYLDRSVADESRLRLADAAAGSTFRW